MDFSNVRKFLDSSDHRWKDLKDKVKSDRDFLSGCQYDADDEKMIGKYRINNTVNIVANTCNSIANEYAKFPFIWTTDIDAVNTAIQQFLHTNNNGSASKESLFNSTSFGLGVMVLSTDTNLFTGNIEPILYSIKNVENVYLDPTISTINGQDAQKGAIVEIKSRAYIRDNFGEEFLESKSGQCINENIDYDRKVEQPVITYYFKEQGKVFITKWTNGVCVFETTLPISFIPVVPVFGEAVWDNGKPSYQGIVRKIRPVQKLLNLSLMQLSERLAMSPKNTWLATRQQVEGVENYFKESGRNLNPLLIYNGTDKKGNKIDPPTRLDNQVQFNDLQGIINSILDLMTSISGVRSTGIADIEKTATESVLEASAYQNNVSHFYDNLKSSFKLIGTIFCQLIQAPISYIETVAGVEELHQNVEARSVIQNLIAVDPQNSKMYVQALLQTYPNNSSLSTLMTAMSQGKTPRELQLEALAGQADLTIKEKDATIAELQKQLDDFNNQLALEKMKIESNVLVKQEDNRVKLAIADAENNTELLKEEMRMQREDDKEVARIVGGMV